LTQQKCDLAAISPHSCVGLLAWRESAFNPAAHPVPKF